MAADGVPAAIVCGGVVNVTTGCDQARKDFQSSVNCAPGKSASQKRFWPGGPQAPLPGSLGSETSPESRMAAPSRSRIVPVCAAKSPGDRPAEFLGAQPKPQWSCCSPVAAVKERSAYVCAETKACIWSTGTIVQP